jgi:hypothetical protein
MLPPGSGARPSDAWDLVEQYTRITPKQNLPFATSEAQSLAAVVLGRAGLRDSADHVLERVRLGKDVDPEGDLFAIQAISRTLLGERDQALKALERYLTNHPDHRVLKAWWWRDLREDPRFKKLAGAEG